jgi:hypothetical protein
MNLTLLPAHRFRRVPRIALAMTLTVVAVAGPSAMRSAASTVARTECTTTELKIIFINNEDAAGHAYDDLDFTNSSRATCYVEGWPGVSYAKAARGPLVGAPANWARGRRRAVVLAPGATAHAPLTFADSASSIPAQCGRSVSADWLRIYPPDQYRPAFVPLGFSIPACSRAQFWIGPVR